MPVSSQYLDFILEQLQGVGGLVSRRMFSGVGLYSDGVFFGLLYKDRLYFKTDDSTRPNYEARGSEGFLPPRTDLRQIRMSYYTVPADILEDREELVRWARQATEAAMRSQTIKARKSRATGAVRPTRAKQRAKRKR